MSLQSAVRVRVLVAVASLSLAGTALAQLVILPSPRLLTTMPMGGRVGTTVEVSITG